MLLFYVYIFFYCRGVVICLYGYICDYMVYDNMLVYCYRVIDLYVCICVYEFCFMKSETLLFVSYKVKFKLRI